MWVQDAIKGLAKRVAIGYAGRQMAITEMQTAAKDSTIEWTAPYSGLLFIVAIPDGASSTAYAVLRASVYLDDDTLAVMAEGLGGTSTYNTASITIPVVAGRDYQIRFFRCKGSGAHLLY